MRDWRWRKQVLRGIVSIGKIDFAED